MESFRITYVGDPHGVFWVVTAPSAKEAILQLADIIKCSPEELTTHQPR